MVQFKFVFEYIVLQKKTEKCAKLFTNRRHRSLLIT